MAEPFKSTPASRVFGMGLPRRSNLPPATFFGTPIAEERRFLNPKLRQNALAEQELEAKENALAAEQAKRNMELKGQEAMGRAFEELSQGEDIENIFRKNPAIVFSPQFDQLSRATEFVQPSKAVKSLVPNLAKSLPPEFRSEFIAKASNLTNTDEVLGAYTDTELKKSMAEQRGRLGELGVDISQLKPDYLYTPAEEAAFKTKAATAREMAKLDLERKKTSEGALEQARQWALKRGAQANLVNMLDNPSAIYQLGASIGGSRNEAASRQIIDRKSRLFSIAKDELEGAKRDLQDSEFDDPDVIDAKQKILDAAQERYNQARSDFENVLIEPPVEEEGLPGMQLPDYDVYSPEYKQAFEAVTGVPSAARVPSFRAPTVPTAAQRGAATAKDITSSAATGGVTKTTPTSTSLPSSPSTIDRSNINAQLQNIPYSEQKEFLEKIKAENVSKKEIASSWTKEKNNIEKLIKKVVPDKVFPGTDINQLESFAKAALNPNENIIQHPKYQMTMPVSWDILNKAGVPMGSIIGNVPVFSEPGNVRTGTQEVGYQELIQEWAKSFLDKRGKLLPTSQSPTGSTLTPEQQKDLNDLDQMARSK